MLDQTDFNQWFIDNDDMPEAKRCIVYPERLKVLIGNMWIDLHDLPEPMLRGVVEDFKEAQRASLIAKHQF
tara:strand:+ start:11798 stop:12010 length:213 start_codon:yes stop_codon:yes gene_type:complete